MSELSIIQVSYINRINKIFETVTTEKQVNYSTALADITYLLQQIPYMKDPFFHFWFHNLLTAPNQKFIDVLNPNFLNIWQLSAKEIALNVEKYIAELINANCKEEALLVMEKSINYQILIEPVFIENILNKENDNTIPDMKVFLTKIKKHILPKIKENIIADFKVTK